MGDMISIYIKEEDLSTTHFDHLESVVLLLMLSRVIYWDRKFESVVDGSEEDFSPCFYTFLENILTWSVTADETSK